MSTDSEKEVLQKYIDALGENFQSGAPCGVETMVLRAEQGLFWNDLMVHVARLTDKGREVTSTPDHRATLGQRASRGLRVAGRGKTTSRSTGHGNPPWTGHTADSASRWLGHGRPIRQCRNQTSRPSILCGKAVGGAVT